MRSTTAAPTRSDGGAGNDYLSGGRGNDFLHGGDGDDSLVGGIGNTSQAVFHRHRCAVTTPMTAATAATPRSWSTTRRVVLGRADRRHRLRSCAASPATAPSPINGVNVGSLTSIETVIFRGTTVNDTVGGTGNADNLFGGAGDDALYGWFGNDLLEGGDGNDILDGGEGLDTATYANATAGVNVDLRLDGIAQDTGGAGIDTLSGIEYLTGSAFGDTLRGTDDFNLIIDIGVGAGATALSQTDSLFGYGGNDSILVTRAAGTVATNVNMDGGDGDDFIELRSRHVVGGCWRRTPAGSDRRARPIGAGRDLERSQPRCRDRRWRRGQRPHHPDRRRQRRRSMPARATTSSASACAARPASTTTSITLGTGADIIQLGVGSNAANSTDVATTARTNRVTDFERRRHRRQVRDDQLPEPWRR